MVHSLLLYSRVLPVVNIEFSWIIVLLWATRFVKCLKELGLAQPDEHCVRTPLLLATLSRTACVLQLVLRLLLSFQAWPRGMIHGRSVPSALPFGCTRMSNPHWKSIHRRIEAHYQALSLGTKPWAIHWRATALLWSVVPVRIDLCVAIFPWLGLECCKMAVNVSNGKYSTLKPRTPTLLPNRRFSVIVDQVCSIDVLWGGVLRSSLSSWSNFLNGASKIRDT